MNFKVIDEIDIREKTIFVRADLNLPPDDSVILEYKIDYIQNTINYALENDSKLVIASHIDVPGYRYDSR